MNLSDISIAGMNIEKLHQHYRNQDFSVEQLIEHILNQAEQYKANNSWIYLLNKSEIDIYLNNLNNRTIDELPLYGIPFAIKDNIDLAGVPTTAACPEFSYTPEKSAIVVENLIAAGAIPIGKTNLDQFATGLVGTRSPYGETHNSLNPQWVSGGSSSGSAVTVAQGLVSFSLGTDTAGSGRIPAAFNNIIGLKPSRGLLTNQGVVPACQSLDCIAIFSMYSQDLSLLLDISTKYNPEDPFSKNIALSASNPKQEFRFAVPKPEQLEFFGNAYFQEQFQEAVKQMEKLGGQKVMIDFAPFMAAAKLLYEGPWVTERYLAAKDIVDNKPEVLLDVIRNIIEPGKDHKATDVYSALYQLLKYKQQTDLILADVDFLMTPTAGTIYDIEQVNSDPIKLNSNLGYYTNYMNLLDYSAIALPFSLNEEKMPFGITIVAQAFEDKQLISYAKQWQGSLKLSLGAMPWQFFDAPINIEASSLQENINLVVCGAHMSGLALNHQLLERDAVFIKSCSTSSNYKLYALPGGPPERPGLIRQTKSANKIAVEVWSMPLKHFGSFLAGIPHPLGLGKVELEDGSFETGFICESYIENDATDISHLGGWRSYLQSK
ncbi:MAG: allophanate hydrolase [Gammaproteobacteria bacterium]|nr:allophanate hydrolase [Gammaproteobacteria bacterium]